jgi:hypothetical protein
MLKLMKRMDSAFPGFSQSATLPMVLLCHVGGDSWFDRLTVLGDVEGLTTLSAVEGESSVVSWRYVSGCRIRHPGPDPGPA